MPQHCAGIRARACVVQSRALVELPRIGHFPALAVFYQA